MANQILVHQDLANHKLNVCCSSSSSEMDWQQKFSSLAQETEFNLIKVKNQLYTDGPKLLNNGAPVDTNAQLQCISTDQSPGIIAVLQEQLDDQARAIKNLTTAVCNLQEERESNLKTIRQLRDELCKIKDSVMQNGGKQWQDSVTGNLQSLHEQLHLYRVQSGDSSMLMLNNELYKSRRRIQDECEDFRQELSLLKSGLMRLEMLFMSHSSHENNELLRSQNQNDGTLRNITEIQNQQMQELALTRTSILKQRAQLEQLQVCYHGLENQLRVLKSALSREISSRHSNIRQQISAQANAFTSPKLRSETESEKVKTPIDFDLSDSDESSDEKCSQILPPPKEYSEIRDVTSEDNDDEDYLLTDLNLSSEDLSSNEESVLDSNLM